MTSWACLPAWPPHSKEIAFEASLRALDHQEGTLAELRARTGLLLATSSLAVSFLGTAAADGRPFLLLGALGAFAVSVGASGLILVPGPVFTFSAIGPAILERLQPYRDDPAEIHRRLAYDLEYIRQANETAMRPRIVAFRVAAATLAAEIVLLLLAAADTLL